MSSEGKWNQDRTVFVSNGGGSGAGGHDQTASGAGTIAITIGEGGRGSDSGSTGGIGGGGNANLVVGTKAQHESTSEAMTRILCKEHSHYFKDVSHLDFVDVYRVLVLFGVTDPCIQHAIKKLLVAGGRGAGKDISTDIKESIDSLLRWQRMQDEVRMRVGKE